MPSSPFLSELARIYPAQRLLTKPVQLMAYESDALTAFRQRPLAVVLPESQDEVIAAVRLCHQHNVPFVARGSGTSLSGGSLPVEDGIVIAMNRLNRILKLDPQQRTAVVEAGTINLQISLAAERFGLYYAPDPSSQPICTMGGNVAFNSGGAHCLKYGMTSNHILGLKVVLADGEVVEFGSESVEGVGVGPDLVGLFVGCEGTFGIALEITVRLLPKPERYRTMLAAYRDLETAGRAVAAVVASGLLPGAIEIMDRLAIEAAEASVHAGYPEGAEAVLIVELDGEADQVEREFYHLQRVIEDSGAYEVRVAESDEQRLAIWKGRKGAFSAVGRLSPDYVVQDGVVPRGKLGKALGEINRLSRDYELARGQRVPRRRRQSASADPVRRQAARRAGTRRGTGRQDRAVLRRDGRLDHRRARRGHGEAGLPARDVHGRRHGDHASDPAGDGSERNRQPGQDVPGEGDRSHPPAASARAELPARNAHPRCAVSRPRRNRRPEVSLSLKELLQPIAMDTVLHPKTTAEFRRW